MILISQNARISSVSAPPLATLSQVEGRTWSLRFPETVDYVEVGSFVQETDLDFAGHVISISPPTRLDPFFTCTVDRVR